MIIYQKNKDLYSKSLIAVESDPQFICVLIISSLIFLYIQNSFIVLWIFKLQNKFNKMMRKSKIIEETYEKNFNLNEDFLHLMMEK